LALYNGYETLFSTQEARAVVLVADLAALKTDLESSTQAYNSEATSIDANYAALKNREGSVDRTSASQVNAYNSAVAVLRSRVNKLLSLRATIIAKQDIYNAKAAEYNALVVNTNELTKSLDSTLQPTPSL